MNFWPDFAWLYAEAGQMKLLPKYKPVYTAMEN